VAAKAGGDATYLPVCPAMASIARRYSVLLFDEVQSVIVG